KGKRPRTAPQTMDEAGVFAGRRRRVAQSSGTTTACKSRTRSTARARKRSRPTNAENACKPDGVIIRHDERVSCRCERIRHELFRRNFLLSSSWPLLSVRVDLVAWTSFNFRWFGLR